MPRVMEIAAAGVSNEDKGANIREQDVICGRSKLAANHAGNKKFQRIVQAYGDAYQSSKQRQVKKTITLRVIDTMEGSFLRPFFTNGEIVRVEAASREYIYEKVSHALRSAKKQRICSRAVGVRSAREKNHGLSAESAECENYFSRASPIPDCLLSSSSSPRPLIAPVQSSKDNPKAVRPHARTCCAYSEETKTALPPSLPATTVVVSSDSNTLQSRSCTKARGHSRGKTPDRLLVQSPRGSPKKSKSNSGGSDTPWGNGGNMPHTPQPGYAYGRQTFADHNDDWHSLQIHPWQVSDHLQTPDPAKGGTVENMSREEHLQQWQGLSQEFQQSWPIAPFPPLLPGEQQPEPNISAVLDDEDFTPLPFTSAKASKIDCDNPWFPHSPQPNCLRPQHPTL